MKKAVLAIIINDKDEMLLLKRYDTDRTNSGFCLPGGKVDTGESNIEALIREVKEETHLDISIAKSLFTYVSQLEGRDDFLIEVFRVYTKTLNVEIDIREHSSFLFTSSWGHLPLAGNTKVIIETSLKLY